MSEPRANELLRKSLLEVQRLSVALNKAKATSTEPVAIIAQACRTAGDVVSPDGYWALLDQGRDAIGPFPERWDTEALYDPDPEELGKTYAKEGGFLRDVEQFDAAFFGISPREALAMDPQQRLALEVVWEALERAGLKIPSLQESNTGVYLGSTGTDYGRELTSLEALDGYRGTGQASSVLSGRISYLFGFVGPAITVDTACSSSLTALHLACAGLRSGECDLALAGGVQVMSTPAIFVEFSRLRVMARDGRCKPFSARADGAGWGEGCGVLVLKRLSDAQRDGNPILAVVRGSAINQDGHSQGMTAPNGPSQARLIRKALARSALTPDDIDALEAHGTGTMLGDPIEAGALIEVFASPRRDERPLWLGSCKSNIGHTQAASGVLGLIKMVLALEHERLPRTLHADPPSPHIAWADSGIRLLQETQPWPRREGRLRRAGVSSFGISGTNVHVVLEEAPARPDVSPEVPACVGSTFPLLLSGRDEGALRAQAKRWAAWLEEHPHTPWPDVVRTAALHRSHFDLRAALQPNGVAEAKEALTALATGQPHRAVVVGESRARGRVVFVFPGQGSQWPAMGKALLEESPVFARTVSACDAALLPHTGWSVKRILRGEIRDDVPSLDRVDVVQPALFTMAVCLAAVWRTLGMSPAAVVGHSQGEIAAAVVAGALSLAEGARVVALRSRLLRKLTALNGGMAVVELPVDDVTSCDDFDSSGLSIAAVNSRASTVVSGDNAAIDAFLARRSSEGVFCHRVDVDYASHSTHAASILDELAHVLGRVESSPPEIAMVSTVTGRLIEGAELDAGYWCRNLRQPVRLDRALDVVLERGCGIFIEVSTHPVLAMPLTTASAERHGVVVGSLQRGAGELANLHRTLGVLYAQGQAVDWDALLQGPPRGLVPLPTYPFQRQRYWLEAPKPDTGEPNEGLQPSDGPLWDAVTALDAFAVGDLLKVPEVERPKLSELLPFLAAWHVEANASATLDGWRYDEAWLPLEQATSGPQASAVTESSPRTCWLVTDDTATDERSSEALERALAAQAMVIRLTHREALARLKMSSEILREQPEAENSSSVSVVYLPAPQVLCSSESASGARCWEPTVAALTLAQQLAGAGLDARLWWVTPHALRIHSSDVPKSAPLQSLWGLGRAISLEKPELFAGMLDLPDASLERPVLERIAALLLHGPPPQEGDELALRDGKLWVRRLVRAPAPRAKAAWSPSGTVLITGGTGALGRHLARWLAGRGASNIVLASRRGAEAPGMRELVELLRGQGCMVRAIACNMADEKAVDELVARTSSGSDGEPPLRHIFHASGVVSQTSLEALTPEQVQQEMEGKVGGAWALHNAATRHGTPLDTFVLYGSIAGLWGGGGSAAYSAANAGLIGLVHHRHARGLPATVLHWGAWADGGLVTDERQNQLSRRGIRAMRPELAVRAVGHALAEGRGSLAVVDVDWARFAPAFAIARPRPLLMGVPRARAVLEELYAARQDTGKARDSRLRRILEGLPEGRHLETVLTRVQEEIAAVLGFAGASGVAADRPLKELGLDSVTAVELRNRLSTLAGVHLPAAFVFDHPTAQAIATLLLRKLDGERSPVVPPAPQVLAASEEPIAIVAMACRAPGGVIDPEGYWSLLDAGRDAIGPFPARWNTEALYDPDPDAVGKTYAREGGFVDDVEQFDASFFGISPREAIEMDPQQRLVLEVAWEALERAGIRPIEAADRLTGVYIGSIGSDYGADARTLESMSNFSITGTLGSVVSGRLAYVLGLQGPAMTIDTACSSSLVALHLACAGLRQGECDLALAGGVQVISTAAGFVGSSRQRVLAPDGRCKPFSAAADGSGWSEGCGLLVLERLADARRNGHQVVAVVRGSAVNQDGRSQGLTAPNGPSQQRVVRRALAASGLLPDDIDAVEAHGTGTSLGDPIEAGALAEVFGPTRREDRPLWLGSSKSNIGHAQAAAGILGVIKMVLALEKERLPKTLYVDKPSPHVAWQGSGLALLQEARCWAREGGRPRRAGVSSFGISGTNAHVVLEEPPEPRAALAVGSVEASLVPGEAAAAEAPGLCSLPLLVSGRDDAALRAQAGRWADWLGSHPQTDLAAVVRTAAVNRTHFDARAAIQVDGVAQAQEALSALSQGRAHPAVSAGTARPLGGVAFVFPGHGSQWPAMGRALLAESAVFAEAIAACDAALLPHTGWSVRAVLRGEAGAELPPLDRVDVVQPVLFAMAIGLAAVWRSVGVRPDAVIGHSVGEIAAAVECGALSLEDGARMVALRGKLIAAVAERGGMLSIALGEADVHPRLVLWADRLTIGVVNAPDSCVASGDLAALEELERSLGADGVRCRRVNIGFAAHSMHMDGILEAFREALAELRPNASAIPFYSSVTGGRRDGSELDADYWCRNLREVVQFGRAVKSLLDDRHGVFVELGGHPALAAVLSSTSAEAVAIGSLRRDEGGVAALHRNLGVLHTHGYAVGWAALFADVAGPVVPLPTYAFQRQRYWLEPVRPSRASSDWLESLPTAQLEASLSPAARSALPEVFAALRRQQPQVLAAPEDWLYDLQWKPLAEPSDRPNAHGQWLVLADATPRSSAVTDALEAYGGTCRVLQNSSEQPFSPYDAQNPRAVADAIGNVAKVTTENFRGVLILWSTAGEGRDRAPPGLLATLHALQALAAARLVVPCWVLTQQAAKILDDDSPVDPSQRCVWGLAAAAWQEHPELQGGVVDLPSRIDSVVGRSLVATLTQSSQERVVAVRRDAARGWRLRRRPLPNEPWRPRGTILLTGGLGGVGQQVARWLARSGAEHLVLTSKTAPEHPDAPALMAELKNLGVEVTLVATDVSQRDQVTGLISRLRSSMPPLRSVFHLAAMTDDALFVDQNAERVETAWGPKMAGARHLDSLTRDLPLDAFVLFSSLASVLGNAGAANYSAVNAGLDGVAEARRAAGLHAVALNWGLWAGAGLGHAIKAVGVRAMVPAHALAVLQRLLASAPAQAAIVDIDWHGLARLGVRRQPALLSDLVTAGNAALDPALQALREAVHQGVADDVLGPGILEYLISHTAAILGGSRQQLNGSSNLFELGMDSLMLVQLRNQVSTDFDTAVFLNDIASAPTLRQLAQLLLPVSRDWAKRTTATREHSARTSARPASLSAPVRRARLPSPRPPLFILSAPRSGSTLLRVMLAGHPSVFSPPELHLLPTETLAAREALMQGTGLQHGLVRAVMAALNQDRAQAEAAVEQWRVVGWTGREVYLKLNEVTGRLVVDKSPTSAASPEYLARALRWCPEARFLHLVRHPLAMMESFTRMRMHHIVPQTTALDPWEAAERTWQASERNVRDFFAGLSERQRFRIRYEDLVTAPGPTLRNLCDWLDLPYDPQMLDAYGPDRMTDSIAGEKSQIGDPNFHRRDAIDPALADAWRAVRAPRGLDPQTIVLAEACGYVLDGEGQGGQGRAVGPSLPSPAPPAEDAIPEDVEWDLPDGPLAGLRWGSTEARAVLCVHGHREQSLVWLSVARRLVSQGYQVIAPDLRGHGRSPHLHGAGGYPFSVLLRDLAALMDRLPHLEIIVGHSLGGVLCQIVASGSTKKLRGLVLVDVPTPLGRSIVSPSPDLETLIRPRIPKHAPLESREAAAERLCKASPELDPTFALALAERILKPVSNGWKWRWDPRLELPLDGAPLDLHKTIRPDRLPNTAAIFGSRSPLTRSEDLAWVRAVGGRTMLVDAAHHPHLAYPEKVASLVAALQSSGGAPCAPGVSILAGPTPDDLPSGSQSK